MADPKLTLRSLKLDILAIAERVEKELLPAVEGIGERPTGREIEFVGWLFNDEITRLHKLIDATTKMVSKPSKV